MTIADLDYEWESAIYLPAPDDIPDYDDDDEWEDDEDEEMPAEKHTYHLTLSFDCDTPGHAKLIADYIAQTVRTRVPHTFDITFTIS